MPGEHQRQDPLCTRRWRGFPRAQTGGGCRGRPESPPKLRRCEGPRPENRTCTGIKDAASTWIMTATPLVSDSCSWSRSRSPSSGAPARTPRGRGGRASRTRWGHPETRKNGEGGGGEKVFLTDDCRYTLFLPPPSTIPRTSDRWSRCCPPPSTPCGTSRSRPGASR